MDSIPHKGIDFSGSITRSPGEMGEQEETWLCFNSVLWTGEMKGSEGFWETRERLLWPWACSWCYLMLLAFGFFLMGCAEKDKPEPKLSSELMLLCKCVLEQGAWTLPPNTNTRILSVLSVNINVASKHIVLKTAQCAAQVRHFILTPIFHTFIGVFIRLVSEFAVKTIWSGVL